MIRLSHLTKKFGACTAVDDLCVDVREGEVVGLLGPNGAGKTTTMRMITGFMPPSKGRVSIAGFDLYDHPIQAKRKIGYLPEQLPLYPDMTVCKYLAYVAALKDVPAARTKAAVALAMERTRTGEVADTRISTLSKGFRQRVGLAQAIVHEPPVLVLDEPTSSLDPQQRYEVRELITALKGRHTVILSTHILPEASDVADRVVIINRGKVMAVDTPANLAGRLRACESVRLEIGARAAASAVSPDAVRESLAALPGVLDVHAAIGAAGIITARIDSAAGVDLRAEAAALVTGRGWRLLGLSGDSLSLEEIFLALTRDEREGGA
ncbi:MAG: ABC transporter ATP-binding protein [Vicinamibacterales bacterium]|nr:ABC transporter ATP-binding protein [Vicinamibacterales bacterium]